MTQVFKKSTYKARDLGSIPGLGRTAGEGNSYALQDSGLENSRDCIVHGDHKELDTTEQAHTYNKLSVNEYISKFLGKCPLGQ